MSESQAPAISRRVGRLVACVEVRPGCSVWEVEVGGRVEQATAFAELTGPLRPRDFVLLNTTAAELALGTGGTHFILSRWGTAPPSPFPGREAGHILKLRYTPLQLRVMAAEEQASPHRDAVAAFNASEGLRGPVLAAELHSQAAAAALVARAAAPDLRIALVQTDTAALPLAFSRLLARLRAEGAVDATVAAGQAFGGDYEAVNLYSALITAAAVARAELILVTQGPGNVGTETEFGFSGLGLVEAFHAAELLGGLPLLAARMSAADPRPRHQGLSHHTVTLLRCARVPVTLPVPIGCGALPERELLARHQVRRVDPDPHLPALAPYGDMLVTMGRSLEVDPLFFRAAAAAGLYAARQALSLRKKRSG